MQILSKTLVLFALISLLSIACDIDTESDADNDTNNIIDTGFPNCDGFSQENIIEGDFNFYTYDFDDHYDDYYDGNYIYCLQHYYDDCEEVYRFADAGLENVECITGNLTIKHRANKPLVEFESLKIVAGVLYVQDSTTLTDLSDLKNLTSVGSMYISENEELTSLNGLENLTSVPGYVRILVNNKLTSLKGLDNLTSVGEHLYIGGNDTLPNLIGLDSLSAVGVNLGINGAAINSLSGLENLRSVGGGLNVSGDVYQKDNNAVLTNLSGIGNLSSLGGALKIENLAALTSLGGIDKLTSVGGELVIEDNEHLTSLSGLENITGICEQKGPIRVHPCLRIRNNEELPACEAMNLAETFDLTCTTDWESDCYCENNNGTGTCD